MLRMAALAAYRFPMLWILQVTFYPVDDIWLGFRSSSLVLLIEQGLGWSDVSAPWQLSSFRNSLRWLCDGHIDSRGAT